MNKTRVEWIVNPDGSRPGWVWNPITGCLNGCEYCYASRVANTRLKSLYLANEWVSPAQTSGPGYHTSKLLDRLDPFYPRFWPERLQKFHDQPIGIKPKGVFVCSMGDLFGVGIPELWTKGILKDIGSRHSQHRFYLLTKQPQNLAQFSPFSDNCYVGVTATDSEHARRAMIELSLIEAKVKYLSIEPLLDSAGNSPWKYLNFSALDWVIIGAQTKPTVMPKIEQVKEIVEAANRAGVKVFLKDSLKPLFQLPDGIIRPLRQEEPL